MIEAVSPHSLRSAALNRAVEHSSFLRELARAWPDVAGAFVEHGADAAAALALTVEDGTLEQRLRRQRGRLALAVALGDLSGDLPLEAVTRYLSNFADQAIDEALAGAIAERVPGATPSGFAVIAMGKLGSGELNYSSDVDLLLLFDPAAMPRRPREEPGEAAVRIGQRLIAILQQRTADGYVARVDLRLRPSPEVTPIALPVDAAISHYESSALPWERAAFIRARACAGDLALGQSFLDAIKPFVWRRSLDLGIIEDIRGISARIRDHYAQGARLGPGYDLKRGRGGIREIEFFVQIQQMIQGGRHRSMRAPATLNALAKLSAAGHLDAETEAALASAYRLLRTIEHRVQMVEDAQTHILPAAPEALDNVAQLHGLNDAAALLELLSAPVEQAGAIFDGLAPDQPPELSSDRNILTGQLAQLGFPDAPAAARQVADWRSGKARALRSPAAREAFEAMLPALLVAIGGGGDPLHALNRLADIIDGLSSGVNFFRLLSARPPLAALLAKVLAHAPALSGQLGRRPILFEGLFDATSFEAPPAPDEFAALLEKAMAGRSYDFGLDRARQLINERRFALGVQLIDRRRDPLEIAKGYSGVAEGAIQALGKRTIAEFEAGHGGFDSGELVVLGLGRLGGGELTHASDLDIIYVHTAESGVSSGGARALGPNDYFNRLASRVTAALSVPTAAGPLYEVDTRLRPEGSKGMLAVSLDAFERYQREEAWTWEHMALCRARPVFSSVEGRARAQAAIEAVLNRPRDPAQVIRDAVKMRSDMERHKPAVSDLDVKLGRGGLIDLEFAVHVLQLTRRTGFDPHLGTAIRMLVEEDLIDASVVEAQELLTRMLVMMRLVAPGDVKPTADTWQLVAETCGASDWDSLLAQHRAARQSIAALWDRIKGEA